jgi:hypothetical protein
VETHPPDPTSNGKPDPWDSVSTELGSLGHRLREAYRKAATDRGPSEEEIGSALATLAGAWEQVATSFSAALADPAIRAQLKQAAGSLAAAVGVTISALGDELSGGSAVSETSGDEAVEQRGAGGGVVDGDGEPPTAQESEL